VHYTTAFRWRLRFLAALAGDKPEALAGIVEGDETFILESFKGKRSGMARKCRKRGGKSAKRGLSAEQSRSSWRVTVRDRPRMWCCRKLNRVHCRGAGRGRLAGQRILL
jgi:hypothetical protein